MNPGLTTSPRIAVIGAGARGERMAAFFAGRGALVGICDLDPTRRAVANAHGVPAWADLLAVLADDAVDTLAFATPPGTQGAMALTALQADRNVLLSGDTLDPAEVRALRAAQGGRVVRLIDGWRAHPAAERLTAWVADGKLGTIQLVTAERFASVGGPPVAVAHLGIALRLFGARPERVHAEGAALRGIEAIDWCHAHLRFANGGRATLHRSALHPTTADQLVVIGSLAAARLDLSAPPSTALTRWSTPDAATVAEIADDHPLDRACAAALDGLRTGVSDLDDALRTLEVMAMIRQSLDTGGPVTAAAPAAAPGLHPTVQVDGPVEIGPGTRVWHFSKLLGPVRIGARCTLGQNVVVERDVHIGDNVKIQNNVSVYSGVILEDDVFCGPSMVFTNVGTPRSHLPRRGQYQVTRVRRGASIGANATVICGHTLGRYCFIGAGAVVTRDVPDFGLVYGNPARLHGFACYCGARLPLGVDPAGEESAACPECGRGYERRGHAVSMYEEDE
ncbi:MAG: Gfo/Idh/MocA family oxidoreductase [Myxococcales bacterium]|nr:Gfo/Idh/MocA family oxidoreductase [Myxococcales bacterium]